MRTGGSRREVSMRSRSQERPVLEHDVTRTRPPDQLTELSARTGGRQLDPAPGNRATLRSLARSAPIQARAEDDRFEREALKIAGSIMGRDAHSEPAAPIQLSAAEPRSAGTGTDIAQVARAGVRGSGATLPHFDAIQRAFGSHDVSHVQAYTGAAAAAACRTIGAQAYATGDRVAFARAPSLHTAAHEAAHTVQQRAGVALRGGVGEVGDAYERHADAVADAVTRGRSAQALLDAPIHASVHAPGVPPASAPVQRKDEDDKPKKVRFNQPLSEKGFDARFAELYEQAEQADKWLGKFMTEVSKAVGGQGLAIIHPPLKNAQVARSKCVRGDDLKDPDTLLDIARATISLANMNLLFRVRDYIADHEACAKMVDRLGDPKREAEASGYKDIKFFLREPDTGHFCELQLHLKMLKGASPIHHPWYEIVRLAGPNQTKDVVVPSADTKKLGAQLQSGWVKLKGMNALEESQLESLKEIVALFFDPEKPSEPVEGAVTVKKEQAKLLMELSPLVYAAFEEKAQGAYVMQDGVMGLVNNV